jgi:ligand-binding SRPBCC domain-containing protein
MPQWVFSGTYPQAVSQVFAVFCRPANRVRLASTKLNMQLLEVPDRLRKGSRLTLRGRRYGLSQTIELEVTAFTAEELLIEEQVRGPFRSWRQRYQFETTPEGGTLLTETIDYEPPGGLLGLQITAQVIERDLRELYDQREPLLRQLLSEELAGEMEH